MQDDNPNTEAAGAATGPTHRAVPNDLFDAVQAYLAEQKAGETGGLLVYLQASPHITVNPPVDLVRVETMGAAPEAQQKPAAPKRNRSRRG